VLQTEHLISVLTRYEDGALTAQQVSDWANAVESRDDVAFDRDCEACLKYVLFQLANPGISEPLSLDLARRLKAELHGESDSLDDELLHFAAQDGDIAEVRRLLSEGHDVNAFDDLGKTPLHYAVEEEHFEVAKYLIDCGANVNAHHEPSIGNTPLAQIAEYCSLRIAKLLIDSGADPTIAGWMQLAAIDRARRRTGGDGPDVYDLLVRASTKRHA
jgi:hypothetical protein